VRRLCKSHARIGPPSLGGRGSGRARWCGSAGASPCKRSHCPPQCLTRVNRSISANTCRSTCPASLPPSQNPCHDVPVLDPIHPVRKALASMGRCSDSFNAITRAARSRSSTEVVIGKRRNTLHTYSNARATAAAPPGHATGLSKTHIHAQPRESACQGRPSLPAS